MMHPGGEGEMTLLVDVGTNTEIVLGNKDRLLACSSPTGPAFEGAQKIKPSFLSIRGYSKLRTTE